MAKNIQVLIVDDDNEIRSLLSRFMQREGFSTETAENGSEGLLKFINQPSGLVLTDIQMPYMDGLSFAREIKKIQPKTAVIIMTGDVQLSLQAKGFADFVLIKPFELTELYKRVQTCLRNQEHQMNVQTEFRNSERISHESMITLQDDFGYPYYGMMYNVNRSGLYFQALHEILPGKSIHIQIEDLPPGLSQNSFRAKVVWCEKLNDNSVFRYGIGIKYC